MAEGLAADSCYELLWYQHQVQPKSFCSWPTRPSWKRDLRPGPCYIFWVEYRTWTHFVIDIYIPWDKRGSKVFPLTWIFLLACGPLVFSVFMEISSSAPGSLWQRGMWCDTCWLRNFSSLYKKDKKSSKCYILKRKKETNKKRMIYSILHNFLRCISYLYEHTGGKRHAMVILLLKAYDR